MEAALTTRQRSPDHLLSLLNLSRSDTELGPSLINTLPYGVTNRD